MAQESVYHTVTITSLTSRRDITTSLATDIQTSLTTEFSTAFEDLVSTIVVSLTLYETVVLTATTTSGSTVTLYTPAPNTTPLKRDLGHAIRAISTTSKAIPLYASACRNFAEYVEACSLIGVTTGTSTLYSTLPAITTTSFQSLTSASTEIVTETSFITSFITVTSVTTTTITQSLTETIPTVLTNTQSSLVISTIGTVTIPVTSYITVPPTSVATVTVPIPNFIVKMVPVAQGPTLYLQNSNVPGDTIGGVTDPSSATTYTINSVYEFIDVSHGFFLYGTIYSLNSYMRMASRQSFLSNSLRYMRMTCNVDQYKELSCAWGGVPRNFTLSPDSQFYYSDPNYSGQPSYRGFMVPV